MEGLTVASAMITVAIVMMLLSLEVDDLLDDVNQGFNIESATDERLGNNCDGLGGEGASALAWAD